MRRWFTGHGDDTEFTHAVSFTGPLSGLFGFLLGRRFQRALPLVMNNLRLIAERLEHEQEPWADLPSTAA